MRYLVASHPLHFVPELSEYFIDFVTSSAFGGRACVQMKVSASGSALSCMLCSGGGQRKAADLI